jgi:hypothetical protein
MESDWQKFRDLVPALRERYLSALNVRIARKLADSGRTGTQRFWDAKEEMDKEVRILRACLDGHSRSTMWVHMIAMREAGMLKREDLANFSEELKQQVFD